MTPTKTIEAICSLDNQQAWLGAWEIVRANNHILDTEYLPHLRNIRSACLSLPKPSRPSLRDSRDIVKTAVKILEARSAGLCRCTIYSQTDQLFPEKQAKFGLVDITQKEVLNYEYSFTCECRECGQTFNVLEVYGYHYPWTKWKKAS